MLELIAYLLTGCCSAFLSGLLGIGGGLITVPALILIFTHFQTINPEQLMHVVIGTSLAASSVNLISSVIAHHRQQAVRWPVFIAMMPGIIAGALILGPGVMIFIKGNYLKLMFGIFCIIVSIRMFIEQRQHATHPEKLPQNKVILFITGLFIGSIATLLGIAGGALTGPLLNFYRMHIRQIIGTTAALGLVITVAGTLGLILASYHQSGLPKWSTGFIYWPALLGIAPPSLLLTRVGAKLAHKLPAAILKKVFAGLVAMVGIKMLI